MDLLKTSVLSAAQTAFKILSGFVLVKVVALAAGPQGVAQLGQFQNLLTVITILSGGMFYTGVTKLVAERAKDYQQAYTVVYAASKASLLAFLFVVIAVAIWHTEIAVNILKMAWLDWSVLLLPVFAFFTVVNGLWLATLNGFRRVREMVTASIAASLLMVILTLALALPFGEVGAYIAILAPPAIVICIVGIKAYRRKSPWLRIQHTARLSEPPYHALGRFAVMGVVSAVALPVAQMVMREYLTSYLSSEQAGIWQGITRISEVYLLFVTSSLSVYFLPKLAQVSDRQKLIHLVNSVLKLAVPVSLFLGVIIYLCRDLLINLLFTSAFQAMKPLFFLQIIGDMIKILSWVFAYVVLVRGTALIFTIGEVIFNFTYPILGMYFVPRLGLQGAVVAYGVNYVLYLVYVFAVAQRLLKKTENSNA